MPSPVGGLPQKKNQFCAKNYAILRKFWYFFPILQHKVGEGDYPPVLKVGTYPPAPPPRSDAYGCQSVLSGRNSAQNLSDSS